MTLPNPLASDGRLRANTVAADRDGLPAALALTNESGPSLYRLPKAGCPVWTAGEARSADVETTRRHTSAVAVWDAGRVLLVFLHGPAAAGKLTTARELSGRLGFPVFHNHLVVDLLTTISPATDLAIDTDTSPPRQTAQTIIDHFDLRAEPATIRYPT